MSEALVTILLTSGVVAAVITSVLGLISIGKTNKRLLLIETIKNDNSIQTFRYSKLYELNIELNNLPEINYNYLTKKQGHLIQDDEMLTKVVSETTKRFSLLTNIYHKSRPLFDSDIITSVQQLIEKESNESNKIVNNLYSETGNHDISILMDIRIKLENELQMSIIKQLEKLMK